MVSFKEPWTGSQKISALLPVPSPASPWLAYLSPSLISYLNIRELFYLINSIETPQTVIL